MADPAATYLEIMSALDAARPKPPPTPVATTGTLEAGLRGATSAATMGGTEALINNNPALAMARVAQGFVAKQAQDAAVDAAKSGDPLAQMSAESTLKQASARLADISSQEEMSNAAMRARSTTMLEEHPIAHGVGSLLGTLTPGGAVGAVGRLAGRVGGLAGFAGRTAAEGAAMGLQSGVEQGAISGEMSAQRIASSAILGAATNALLGVGGLGLSKVVGKAWKAGSSRILGEGGADLAAATARIDEATGKLGVIDAAASKDATLAAQLAAVKEAHAAGTYARLDEAVLGGVGKVSPAEAQAATQLSALKAGLKRAGIEDGPILWLDTAAAARKAAAEAQAKVQEHAAEAIKGRLEGAAGLGAAGGAAHGFSSAGEDSDPIETAMHTVKHALVGAIAGHVAGGIAGKLFSVGAAGIAGKLASGAGGVEALAARAAPSLARAGTETALHVLTPEQFGAASQHVRTLASMAPDIQQATTDALLRAGWSPLAAADAGARRGATLALLSESAAGGDRVGFSRMLDAVSTPERWAPLARTGGLSGEHVRAMSTAAPVAFAALAEQARQALTDPRTVRSMPAVRRRMLEAVSGLGGATVGTIQQAAFGQSSQSPGGETGITKSAVPPQTPAQASEARLGK